LIRNTSKTGLLIAVTVPHNIWKCCIKLRNYEESRIFLKLDKPTRDGETEIALFTNLPEDINASIVADLYRKRWKVETAFQVVTETFKCEIKTLGYQASRFIFILYGAGGL
ncbi:hypothetical protein QUA82_35850, partial [Microcoleus sp. F8-D3]